MKTKLPVTVQVEAVSRHPSNPVTKCISLEQDLHFLASRLVEMSTAYALLRCGLQRQNFEQAGHKYLDGENGKDLILQAERICNAQQSDEQGNPWKSQELHRILGDSPLNVGLQMGLWSTEG